jgi:hypothetical protein
MDFQTSEEKKRQSIRLPEYDYTRPGAYFVMVVTHQRACLFGSARGDIVILSEIGRVVEWAWRQIPAHFSHVTVMNMSLCRIISMGL